MKKKQIPALALVLMLTLAACGSNSSTPSGGNNTPSPSPTQGTNEPTGTQDPTTTPSDNGGETCNIPGCPHDGYGIYEWSNDFTSWVYEGEWKDCAPNGEGSVESIISATFTYEGTLVNGLFHGKVTGVIMPPNGGTADRFTYYEFEVDTGVISLQRARTGAVPNDTDEWVAPPPDSAKLGMAPWAYDGTPVSMPSSGSPQTPSTPTEPGTTTPTPDPTPTTPATSGGSIEPLEAELGAEFGLWDNHKGAGSDTDYNLKDTGIKNGTYILHRAELPAGKNDSGAIIAAAQNAGLSQVDSPGSMTSGTFHLFNDSQGDLWYILVMP